MTVIDAAEFYTNLDSMKEVEQGETTGTIAELLMEQVRDIFFLDNPGLKLEPQTNYRQKGLLGLPHQRHSLNEHLPMRSRHDNGLPMQDHQGQAGWLA